MFFVIQAWFQIVKHSIEFSFVPLKIDVKGIWGLLSKNSYPSDYVGNRFFILGSIFLIALPIAYGFFVKARLLMTFINNE